MGRHSLGRVWDWKPGELIWGWVTGTVWENLHLGLWKGGEKHSVQQDKAGGLGLFRGKENPNTLTVINVILSIYHIAGTQAYNPHGPSFPWVPKNSPCRLQTLERRSEGVVQKRCVEHRWPVISHTEEANTLSTGQTIQGTLGANTAPCFVNLHQTILCPLTIILNRCQSCNQYIKEESNEDKAYKE